MGGWLAAQASAEAATFGGETFEQIVVSLAVVFLGLSSLLTLGRIARGPSVLDRAIGSEVLVAIMVCALGVEAAYNRHTTTIPLLISLSFLGFMGSVAVARFVPRDADPGRVQMPDIPLTEEVAEGPAEQGAGQAGEDR